MLALAAVAAGCGSDDEDKGGSAQQAQTNESKAESVGEERTQLRVLAADYLKAYGQRRFKVVCGMLAPDVVKRLEREAGSCAKAYQDVAPAATRLAEVAALDTIKLKGDRAEMQGGGGEGEGGVTLHAVKVGDRWLMTDKGGFGDGDRD